MSRSSREEWVWMVVLAATVSIWGGEARAQSIAKCVRARP